MATTICPACNHASSLPGPDTDTTIELCVPCATDAQDDDVQALYDAISATR